MIFIACCWRCLSRVAGCVCTPETCSPRDGSFVNKKAVPLNARHTSIKHD
jgi:hypothetical protein